MHLNSELLFRKYAKGYFKDHLKVLEIGPAGYPSVYQKIIDNPSITWHTLDFSNTAFIDSSADQLTYKISSAYEFPVESDSYDIILSGQVIEHVQRIWTWLRELKRITKPGGQIITVNPVSWPYHEAPVDCWRIFPEGMKALAEEVGLDCKSCFFESLEKDYLVRKYGVLKLIPGRSCDYIKSKSLGKKIRWNKCVQKIPVLKLLEIPIEVAYDTFSVMEKANMAE